jgi:hypothetical protein
MKQEVTVRLNSTRLAGPLALLSLTIGGACRNASRDVTANDALQRDLELAQASTVALAQGGRDLPATRFVSALEAGERPAAGKSDAARPSRRSKSKAPRAHAEHAPPAPAPVAATASVAQAAAEPEAVAPAPAAVPAPVEEQAPARSENPSMSGPSGDGVISVSPTDGADAGGITVSRRGRGGGLGGVLGGIGGVIGVVIRGGAIGDDDHCERDHPGRRGNIPMGVGLPGGMPVGFPARGGYGVPRSGVGGIFRGGRM